MKKSLIILIALPFLLTFCGSRGGGGKSDTETAKKEIILPSIPTVYATREEQMSYLASHYWDNFDFTDTTYINLPEVTEQAMSNFLAILANTSQEDRVKAVDKLLKGARANSEMFAYITELLDKYLYDPNSPMINEELYATVLRYIIASPEVDELNKLRPRAQLEMLLKNRVGERATDFGFTTRAGAKMRLWQIKAPYVVIYFNNPDCGACADVTTHLANSEVMTSLVYRGVVKIVAIYSDEEELESWRNYNHGMPSEWIDAYDPEFKIRDERLYDLRAIPSLYMLDKDKKVVIKDSPSAHAIEEYFAVQGL